MKIINWPIKKPPLKVVVSGLVVLFIIALIVAAVAVRSTYQNNLRPLSDTSKSYVVTIKPGSTTAQIADILKSRGVIRSDWAFEWYVRSGQLRDQLKAGTYLVDQNQSVQEIICIILYF